MAVTVPSQFPLADRHAAPRGESQEGRTAEILPVAQRWGGGPPPQAVVEGPATSRQGPSVSGSATATSPSLRDREDFTSAPYPKTDTALK